MTRTYCLHRNLGIVRDRVRRMQRRRGGVCYIIPRKSVKSLLKRVHERTSSRWNSDEPENTLATLSSLLRGWCGYFDQGAVLKTYKLVRKYTEWRVRRWLMRRAGQRGTGIGQYPDEHLYHTLGLYAVPVRLTDLPRATV